MRADLRGAAPVVLKVDKSVVMVGVISMLCVRSGRVAPLHFPFSSVLIERSVRLRILRLHREAVCIDGRGFLEQSRLRHALHCDLELSELYLQLSDPVPFHVHQLLFGMQTLLQCKLLSRQRLHLIE